MGLTGAFQPIIATCSMFHPSMLVVTPDHHPRLFIPPSFALYSGQNNSIIKTHGRPRPMAVQRGHCLPTTGLTRPSIFRYTPTPYEVQSDGSTWVISSSHMASPASHRWAGRGAGSADAGPWAMWHTCRRAGASQEASPQRPQTRASLLIGYSCCSSSCPW